MTMAGFGFGVAVISVLPIGLAVPTPVGTLTVGSVKSAWALPECGPENDGQIVQEDGVQWICGWCPGIGWHWQYA